MGLRPWPETPWDGFFTGGVRRRRKNCERPALPPKDKEGPQLLEKIFAFPKTEGGKRLRRPFSWIEAEEGKKIREDASFWPSAQNNRGKETSPGVILPFLGIG